MGKRRGSKCAKGKLDSEIHCTVARHKMKISLKCARDNTCKDLLILPEMKWHPSLTFEHRMGNQERLAFCLALLLTPTLILCHFQHCTFPHASVSPCAFCRPLDQSYCMYFFKERSTDKKAKRGNGKPNPSNFSQPFRAMGEVGVKGTMKAGSTRFQTRSP